METARRRVSRRQDDRGVVVVVGAVGMLMLLALASLVLDLAALRNDRRSDQRKVDAAITAGVVDLDTGSGRAACQTIQGYMEHSLARGDAIPGLNCNQISASCSAGVGQQRTTGTLGDYTVTITHPVNDGDVLMTSNTRFAPAIPTAYDGDRCDRIGLRVTHTRTPFFAFGGERTTAVHAVARISNTRGPGQPISLVTLNRTDCPTVSVSGNGTPSGVVILPVPLPGDDRVLGTADDTLGPGHFSVDSDGSNCGGSATLKVSGGGATIRADGPPGCAGELVPGTGQGCGSIRLHAARSGSGCYQPACVSSGMITPLPEGLPDRVTRAPIEYRYNCKGNYRGEPWYAAQPIGACTQTSRPYVEELRSFVGATGTPPGFKRYEWGLDQIANTPDDFPCTISGVDVVVPEGNWHVGCSLKVNRSVVFLGGNVVFDSNVSLQGGSGSLVINKCGDDAGPNSCVAPGSGVTWAGWPQDFTEAQYSADAAWALFRTGSFDRAGKADVFIHNTAVIMSRTSGLSLSGNGGGNFTWYAPTAGPFEDLSLWASGTASHNLSGDAALKLEGVFFVPNAPLSYTGQGAQHQVAAQFIVNKLDVSGSGQLYLRADYERSVPMVAPTSQLIR